jgi:hypothetical protein
MSHPEHVTGYILMYDKAVPRLVLFLQYTYVIVLIIA